MGRHWLVTVTGVTLKHCIEVLQSSYNLCATSAKVTNFHNSEKCLSNTTFCKAWQSATELNMNLMMRIMVMMAFLPGWYLHHGSDVVAMKMILVTTLMLLVIMMLMRQ